MLVAIFVVVGLMVVVVFVAALRVPRAGEALIVSGRGIRSTSVDGMGRLDFKIATAGKATIAVPLLQVVRRLRLYGHTAALDLRYVAPRGIHAQVRGTVSYRIGGDVASIANAARRFLGEEESMDRAVAEVFSGHLRSILGDLDLESFLYVRNLVAREAESSADGEMSGLGLITVGFDLSEIDDEDGHLSDQAHRQMEWLAEANEITLAELELLDDGSPGFLADLERHRTRREQAVQQALIKSQALVDARSARARAEYEQQAAERRRAAWDRR